MSAAWDRARRILCVRLDSLGDVLMTTPALRALKESGRGRRLTLLTSRTGAALAKHLPMVDDVWTYDAPWVKHPDVRGDPVVDLDMIDRLLAGRFDAAVIFTVYSQSPLPAAMMCWLAGIPLRLAHCRENPYELLTDRVPETEPDSRVRHEVARQLALVRAIGAKTCDWRMAFEPGDAARRALHSRLRAALLRIGGPRRPAPARTRWLVVHPGASAASRRWPAERFGDVAARLAPLFDGIAVTGGTDERALVDAVCERAGPRAVPLAGVLPLGELGALIETADLLLTNNSGPVHLAAALGTPVVDLYALTNPQHTPWRVPHRALNVDVPCRNCYRSVCNQPGHPCLLGVSVDDVVEATHGLLRRSARHAQHAAARATLHAAEPVAANASSVSNVIPFAQVITRT
ncbi:MULTISPECIES: glycosyltransferase family 9 protein [unclassified Burkholderia]|uniref:glycosyltransferase family 9 protein n=1 Tax=unclassified Burkholderia TaxID=2613784 RepID=UPI000F578840|nr:MULTISPECIES: glycosyltransferase family 9 protein [unclassified Burkholderia]RQR40893.1 glycosyltransferase family 9 protein [Burkholderia sp. Bp9131]RQR69990.1 glycosyltransferase family 9 protein [Burkholderia sp. Bp9015]RQS46450.1 glycosyltransferase family 9 protein [Burkholderia sp. Bp8990]RQZ51739.1 glycosyltransferase family 9 protein [Burkholderia sp. Bp9099]